MNGLLHTYCALPPYLVMPVYHVYHPIFRGRLAYFPSEALVYVCINTFIVALIGIQCP
jgi:hypothetical protein